MSRLLRYEVDLESCNDLVQKLLKILDDINLNEKTPGPAKLGTEVIIKFWSELSSNDRACADESVQFFLSHEYKAWMSLIRGMTNTRLNHHLLVYSVQQNMKSGCFL
ncbi:MAG: hypothetical protein IBX55_19610 [Methyloprofundus sp.]|nr:hypothetical protein [Methyloprofundus sp.]